MSVLAHRRNSWKNRMSVLAHRHNKNFIEETLAEWRLLANAKGPKNICIIIIIMGLTFAV